MALVLGAGAHADSNDTRATAFEANIDSTWDNSFHDSGDVDWFYFDVPSRRTVRIWTTGEMDTFGRLEDGAGNFIEANDDSGAGFNFRIVRTLDAGRHYLRVTEFYSETGPYTLHFRHDGDHDDHGDTRGRATRIGPNSTTQGELEQAGDVDYFRFEVPSRGAVVVETSGGTDTYGILQDGDGREVAADDDSGVDLNFRIEYTLDPGTHYVRVRGYNSTATGGYALRVSHTPEGGGDDAAPIEDFPVVIPGHCPREVEVCVRDHECEDGDEIRVTVNGGVVFEGELFNRWQCADVAVGVGDNAVELLALNGSGFKGPCSYADANTGEIRVTSPGGAREVQSWRHRGGAGSRASLVVGVGPSSGSCAFDPSAPPPDDGLPDLVVESPSASASGLAPGQSFTLSARVRNQGGGAAAATTLRWRRSADAGISGGDDQVGTGGVAGLAAGASAGAVQPGWSPAALAQRLGDFNGDGKADVLLRREDGRWLYQPMDGRRVLAGGGEVSLTRDLRWRFAGVGDLNGDGKSDVLLRHEDGRWYYYLMDGRRPVERGAVELTEWLGSRFAGLGDLNGDGKSDVLLRHADGSWSYYLMDGGRIVGAGAAGLAREPEWRFAAMGDLNGDGKDDVLLRHEDGRWYYYPQPLGGGAGIPGGGAALARELEWRLAGIGDLNGDGKDDVLLRHEDGRWWYSPMDGRRSIAGQRGNANLARELEWRPAGIGDLNGDGKDDVLLRHEDGRWWYSPMDGRSSIAAQRGGANLDQGLGWAPVSQGPPAAGGEPAAPEPVDPGPVDPGPVDPGPVDPGPGTGGTSPGSRFRDCPECPEMVVVPSGTFLMGAPESEAHSDSDERPVHRVSVPSFAVGVYEVTFAEWDACVAAGGCGGHSPDDEGWGRGRRPVVNVDWRDAQLYVEWLSGRTGHRYRLLSESEWEYAARAGTTGPLHTGSTISTEQANYGGCYYSPTYSGVVQGECRIRTLPVGTFPANGFGLHDVHGNVQEWVQDRWNRNYEGAPSDGSAWESRDTALRVTRGGDWNDPARELRSANRNSDLAGARFNRLGFRVARTL